MYNVGRSLRTRYHKLIPRYHKNIVSVTSSESSRAAESASYVAAGMFHPDTEPVFDKKEGSTTWRRVPIWENALFDKHKLFSQKRDRSQCPKFTAMREQVKAEEKSRASPTRKEFYRIINEMILIVYNQSEFINSFMDNSKAYDTFQAWILDDQEVPSWIVKVFPVLEKMKQLRMWIHIHSKPNMMRFLTGTLLNQMFIEMDDASKSSSLKVHFHGSHDIPVCALVWGIVHDEKYLALPGDTVVVEMTADGLVKVYLYVPLKKDRRERFQILSLESLCGKEDCSLVEFKNALKELTFDEDQWKQICNDKSGVDPEYRTLPQDIDDEDLIIMNEAMSYLKNVTL
ncbi:uncharacterized protein LOC129003278 [Macrosteles quadrilineatus]|uniref:uncharacterized protein LOC129003278 n=1 Tax=Macrosteles quadrilineatus TaxID=74068 RepID=UPI0023E21E65|nr:uncharacterized protein LOC129003278 [Macrosteles quadrilineatus]